MLDGRCSQGFMGRGDPQNGNSSSPAFSSTSRREGGDSAHPFRVSRRDPGPEKSPHEAGSAGTLAGELPVELFAGKGAGAPGDGSWVQGFNARNFWEKSLREILAASAPQTKPAPRSSTN